jgi:methanogenic corrinoid protein MtbC1
MTDQLVDAIVEMRDDEALEIAKSRLEAGTPPTEILEACRAAMTEVGARFEQGEYFVPELILAGEMLRSISDLVKPLMKNEAAAAKKGKIVLGTVAGDIHDIGKDIVYFMLDVNGFEVIDLGVDVPVATFVEAVRTHRPQVVALSGFLTLAFDSMRDTIAGLRDAGLRDSVKVMIGGGVVDEQVRSFTGADAFGLDAMAAVTIARRFIEAA